VCLDPVALLVPIAPLAHPIEVNIMIVSLTTVCEGFRYIQLLGQCCFTVGHHLLDRDLPDWPDCGRLL